MEEDPICQEKELVKGHFISSLSLSSFPYP